MEFLRPRLVGKRFQGHEIPLEMLKDLAVLQELIIQVAKEEFLKDNPGRQRSPRGFTDGVSLSLSGVEDGSAIPVIVLTLAMAPTGLFPPPIQTYLERGRDQVVRAIAAADQGKPPSQFISEKSLAHFDQLGRSLKSDEAIEFTEATAAAVTPARLTLASRRSLLLSVASTKEYSEEATLRGVIPEMDRKDATFELELEDGTKFKAPLPSEHHDTILTAFNGWHRGDKVIIKGVGRFDRSNKLLSLASVEDVSLVDSLDVLERLSELKELPDGWLDGEGVQLNADGLDWLATEWDTAYPSALPLPRIYPTTSGNVRLEWQIQAHDISLDIDLTSRNSVWHRLNLETDEEQEASFDLAIKDGWQSLFGQLQSYGGGQ